MGGVTAPRHMPSDPFGNMGFWALKQTCTHFPNPVSVGSFLYLSQTSRRFKTNEKQQTHTCRRQFFFPISKISNVSNAFISVFMISMCIILPQAETADTAPLPAPLRSQSGGDTITFISRIIFKVPIALTLRDPEHTEQEGSRILPGKGEIKHHARSG